MKKDNKGLTLVELLISSAILGLVLVAVFSFMGVATKYYSAQSADTSMQDELQSTFNYISTLIMAADKGGVSFSGNTLKIVKGDTTTYIKQEGTDSKELRVYQNEISGKGELLSEYVKTFNVSVGTGYASVEIEMTSMGQTAKLAQNVFMRNSTCTQTSGSGTGTSSTSTTTSSSTSSEGLTTITPSTFVPATTAASSGDSEDATEEPTTEPIVLEGISWSYEAQYLETNEKQYNFIFTNPNSVAVSSTTFVVPYYGNVTSVSMNGGTATVDTASKTITFVYTNYNSGIPANTTTHKVYTVVSGGGYLGEEPVGTEEETTAVTSETTQYETSTSSGTDSADSNAESSNIENETSEVSDTDNSGDSQMSGGTYTVNDVNAKSISLSSLPDGEIASVSVTYKVTINSQYYNGPATLSISYGYYNQYYTPVASASCGVVPAGKIEREVVTASGSFTIDSDKQCFTGSNARSDATISVVDHWAFSTVIDSITVTYK